MAGATDNDLHARIKAYLFKRVPRRLEASGTNLSRRWAWFWGYEGRAASALYAATRDADILALIMHVHDRMTACRDDQTCRCDEGRDKPVKSWSTPLESPHGRSRRVCEIETMGLALLPFTDLLLRVGPELPADFRRALMTTIVDGLEVHFDDLIDDPFSGGGYFRSPWNGAVEPMNHAHLLAAAAAEAFALTGTQHYAWLAIKVYTYFAHNWYREDNDTVAWSYCPVPGDARIAHKKVEYAEQGFRHQIGGEYFYKAGVTIELPAAMHRAGLMDDADMKLIAHSLRSNVFLPDAKLNYYISPRKTCACGTPLRENSVIRPNFIFSPTFPRWPSFFVTYRPIFDYRINIIRSILAGFHGHCGG